MSKTEVIQMPIHERKWWIHRFVEQKNKENAAIETARRNAKNKG